MGFDTTSVPFPLGKTVDSIPDAALGAKANWPERDPDNDEIVTKHRSITAILVKNASGVTLNPCEAVVWAANDYGLEVGAKVSTTNAKIAGVVDPLVSSVPANNYFWLVIRGPVKVFKVATGSTSPLAAESPLVALTANGTTAADAGRLQLRVLAGSTDTTDSTLAAQIEGCAGIAITAATTAETKVYAYIDATKYYPV